MKNRFFFLLMAICLFSVVQAQTPAAFNFQAVARDAQNDPVTNKKNIDVRASILNAGDKAIYVETHSNVSTGATGVFSLAIGKGTVDAGTTLTAIDWATGGYSLKIEVNTGTGFKVLQIAKLLAVPYALYANEADNLSGGAVIRGTGTAGTIPKFGSTDSLVNSVITEHNGNIGIGFKMPIRAGLETTAIGATTAIFGAGQNGLSLQQNWSTIGFNQYRDQSDSDISKYMGDGHAWTQYADPKNGQMYFSYLGNGKMNTPTNIQTIPFMITKNGNVGINNTNPSNNLHVKGIIESSSSMANQNHSIKIVPDGVLFFPPGIYMQSATNATFVITYPNNLGFAGNNVGIGTLSPTHKLEVVGSSRFDEVGIGVDPNTTYHLTVGSKGAAKPGGGSWTNSSDRRLKTDIKPFLSGLETVLRINPVSYHYNGLLDYSTSEEHIGVIAQDLQLVAPYMVSEFKGRDGNDYLAVNPSSMDFLFINAFKEQQATILTQQKEIADLKAALEDTKQTHQQKMESLEQKLLALQGQMEALLGKVQVKNTEK